MGRQHDEPDCVRLATLPSISQLEPIVPIGPIGNEQPWGRLGGWVIGFNIRPFPGFPLCRLGVAMPIPDSCTRSVHKSEDRLGLLEVLPDVRSRAFVCSDSVHLASLFS